MKVVIQIPCYNEAESLPLTLSQLPRAITGTSEVAWLIIDDGSTDDTAEVALRHGADRVERHPLNRGLAAAFMTGIECAVSMGADIIVNTDADNQYDARDIATLVEPILAGRAEMVVGARPIDQTGHFSWIKKRLQRLGSAVVRLASGTQVADAPSGFRAFTRDAAMRLNVFGSYTYTLETLIQAGRSNIRVASVPVRTNPDLRPSRLVRSIWHYVARSAVTIVRIFATYRPLTFFWGLAALFTFVGLSAGVRYLYFMLIGEGAGHVQSSILAAASVTVGMILFMLGFLAELSSVNRRLLERIEWRLRRLEIESRWKVATQDQGAAETDKHAPPDDAP
ncbi:MAG TPA: glycosyltransferase family 2 protein [Xanthomonadaceae bacterium]|nr:glycosyltransferase family 2 protein [Xanthomonadaceae bacterium]